MSVNYIFTFSTNTFHHGVSDSVFFFFAKTIEGFIFSNLSLSRTIAHNYVKGYFEIFGQGKVGNHVFFFSFYSMLQKNQNQVQKA